MNSGPIVIRIVGNKPIGPNGECEEYPAEERRGTFPLWHWIRGYQERHGECSSIMLTIVNPPSPTLTDEELWRSLDHKKL